MREQSAVIGVKCGSVIGAGSATGPVLCELSNFACIHMYARAVVCLHLSVHTYEPVSPFQTRARAHTHAHTNTATHPSPDNHPRSYTVLLSRGVRHSLPRQLHQGVQEPVAVLLRHFRPSRLRARSGSMSPGHVMYMCMFSTDNRSESVGPGPLVATGMLITFCHDT